MGKIAYLGSGRTHDRSIKQLGLKDIVGIPMWRSRKVNLMRFGGVIINSGADQDLMSRIRKRLDRFVQFGGILVILGASEDKTKWLPYCTHYPPCLGLDEIELQNQTLSIGVKIFQGLYTPSSLKFHDTFVTHGFFTSTVENITPLVWKKDIAGSLVMAIIQPPKASGKLLVTTLDPDYHATASHTLNGQEYDRNAPRLLQNIVTNWLMGEMGNQPLHIKAIRRIVGISMLSLTWSLSLAMALICCGSIVAFAISLISGSTFAVLGSTSSILSFGFTFLFGLLDK